MSIGITRPFNSAFWPDSYVRSLDQNTKMVYLFLITSHKLTLSGIYEIGALEIARHALCDETRIDEVYVSLDKLKEDKKILYADGWICLLNRMKHQFLNPNMKKGLLSELNELLGMVPESFHNHIESLTKAFGKPYEMVSVDIRGKGKGRVREKERVRDAKPERSASGVGDTHTGVGNPKMGNAFDLFWKAYPKKVHMQEAQMMFDEKWKAIEPAMPRILEFLKAAPKTNRWREAKFIPDPASFLEGKRWTDDLESYGKDQILTHIS